jgi:hypothetical protein
VANGKALYLRNGNLPYWIKVKNPLYGQAQGRAELFDPVFESADMTERMQIERCAAMFLRNRTGLLDGFALVVVFISPKFV